MVFADSKYLLLLWLIPLCAIILVVEMKRLRQRFHRFASSRIDELLTHRWNRKKTIFKTFLLSMVLIFLIIALARPRWNFEWKELPQGGTDIIVALDLSTSMLATDISPSRLERAKREIIDLLGLLKGDRIGIVAFGGVAFVYTPLTVDYRLADVFIKQLNLKLMPVQGTAIGDALTLSIDTLEKASSAHTQAKAIILITDGEDHESDPLAIAKKAKEKGIKIFTIGIGSENGAPIPLPEGGFKKDRNGNIIVSKLDEKTLQLIAAETGASYVRSSSGNLDLDTIYKVGVRGTNSEDGTSIRQKIWHERFQIFLAFAIVLLLLEFFLTDFITKKRRRFWKFLALFFFVNISTSQQKLYASPARDGEKAFQNKDYKTASEQFLKAEIKEPENLQHTYNRAVSQFYNQQFAEAAEGFAKSAQSQDKNLALKSQFNLGNTLAAKKDFENAVKAYEQALKIKPEDLDTKDNLEWAKKQAELEKQKKEQDKNQDQKKDDKKDEQKKDEQQKEQDQKKDDKKDEQKKDQDKNQDQKKDDQKKDSEQKKQDDQKKQEQANKDKENEQKQNKQDANADEKNGAAKDDKKDSQAAGDKKEMSRGEAEKLLRMIEDQEQVYGMPPGANSKENSPERDW